MRSEDDGFVAKQGISMGSKETSVSTEEPADSDSDEGAYDRIAKLFHLPEKEAAAASRKCLTSFKKHCRKHGLERWPHRKVRARSTLLCRRAIDEV